MPNPVPPLRRALGRGLEALLPPPATATRASELPPVDAPRTPEGAVALLAIEQIQPNPFQPRRAFDPEALSELAASIRAQGVLQPILVRPAGSGYELVAGERRLRAATLAGLTQIPALIRPLGDERSLQVAIVENLQRADLNPIEEAAAFQELAQRFRFTQEQIAQHTGRDRSTIANSLRLLRLEPSVVEMLRAGQLSPGQARPLLALEPEWQRVIAEKIVNEGWPARQVEQRVARHLQPPPPPGAATARDPNEREAELQLTHALGAKVVLHARARHRGSIEIVYSNLEEFQRLFERLVGQTG